MVDNLSTSPNGFMASYIYFFNWKIAHIFSTNYSLNAGIYLFYASGSRKHSMNLQWHFSNLNQSLYTYRSQSFSLANKFNVELWYLISSWVTDWIWNSQPMKLKFTLVIVNSMQRKQHIFSPLSWWLSYPF